MTDLPDEPTDEVLAAAAGRDEADAFDRLARRYQVPLRRFLGRCVGASDADDVLQETFVRLYAGRRAFDPRRRFRTWAFTVARRAAIDHLRRRRATSAFAAEAGVDADPAASVEAADERRSIWATAARVASGDQVQAMWLFYAESMSVREVAGVMNRSRLVVRALLSRGRSRLGRGLAARDGSLIAGRVVRP